MYFPLDCIVYGVIGLPINIYSVVSNIDSSRHAGIIQNEFVYKSIEGISLKAITMPFKCVTLKGLEKCVAHPFR